MPRSTSIRRRCADSDLPSCGQEFVTSDPQETICPTCRDTFARQQYEAWAARTDDRHDIAVHLLAGGSIE